MKQSVLMTLILSAVILLSACKGKDGDPGPAGAVGAAGGTGATGADGLGYLIKSGYFKGTVSGNRTDGTAFSEAFDYEYKDQNIQESFFPFHGINYLNITRKTSSGSNQLLAENLYPSVTTLMTDSTSSFLNFNFSKELTGTSIFSLQVVANFLYTDKYVLEISSANNAPYHFANGGNNNNPINDAIEYYSNIYNSVNCNIFYAYIYNGAQYIYINALYKVSDGSLLAVRDNSGNYLSSGSLFDQYNKLVFKLNPAVGIPVFYDKATNTPLSANIPNVAPDQFAITNYKQDATSGVITFDFTVKVSQYRSSAGGTNTTNHDVTITGSFNSGGKVYQSIVSRVAAGQ